MRNPFGRRFKCFFLLWLFYLLFANIESFWPLHSLESLWKSHPKIILFGYGTITIQSIPKNILTFFLINFSFFLVFWKDAAGLFSFPGVRMALEHCTFQQPTSEGSNLPPNVYWIFPMSIESYEVVRSRLLFNHNADNRLKR